MTDGGVINRDGFELEWAREGSGPPMLVLGSTRFYRRYFPQALRDHFEMTFCDLRQWAPTPPGFDVESITLDTWTGDIEAIRVELGLDRPIVAGQSQHGCLAAAYARAYPDSLRGAVVIGTSPPEKYCEGPGIITEEEFWEQDASPERKAAEERNLKERGYDPTATTSAGGIRNYVARGARSWFDYDYDCSWMWDDVEMNLDVMEQLFAPVGLGSWELANDRVPTLLILGRYDYLCPPVHWDPVKDQLSPLTYHLYERSGHQPPAEEPERFTADVVAWSQTLP